VGAWSSIRLGERKFRGARLLHFNSRGEQALSRTLIHSWASLVNFGRSQVELRAQVGAALEFFKTGTLFEGDLLFAIDPRL